MYHDFRYLCWPTSIVIVHHVFVKVNHSKSNYYRYKKTTEEMMNPLGFQKGKSSRSTDFSPSHPESLCACCRRQQTEGPRHQIWGFGGDLGPQQLSF